MRADHIGFNAMRQRLLTMLAPSAEVRQGFAQEGEFHVKKERCLRTLGALLT